MSCSLNSIHLSGLSAENTLKASIQYEWSDGKVGYMAFPGIKLDIISC